MSPVFRPIDRDFIRPRQVAHLLTGSDCSPMNDHNHSTLSALRGQIVLMSRDLFLVVNETPPVPWIVFDEPSCEQTRLQRTMNSMSAIFAATSWRMGTH